MAAREEYRNRLQRWRASFEQSDTRFRQLSNARLFTGLAGVVIAAVSLGASWISPWWLLAPIAVFAAFAVMHERVVRVRTVSSRAVSYYDGAVARMENRWAGKGRQGTEFREPKHVYADDLDLFGEGSLFELLSTARTSTGERTLANWLLVPGEIEAVRERQAAVAELRDRLDLREEIALMGEDVRAGVDDKAVTEWGSGAPVRFIPGARWIASALSCAMVIAAALSLAQVTSVLPVLIVVLAELVFAILMRDPVRAVLGSVSTPAHDLHLLGLLLARLEKEQFQSDHLKRLTHSLDAARLTASAEIHKLEKLVDRLDWARNSFFRIFAAMLVWIPQFAMAIERWRVQNGPHIGEWIASAGEFEALCSLATFSYEREDAVFPELVESSAPLFQAQALRHPLIAATAAIANDVLLSHQCAVWIVSGSNMSGKSTLLRSVGIATVLAWAGAPVTCGSLRVSRVKVGASIRINDSLADHKSRFYAEISRLRDVVELARAGEPLLFLLDELLSGTNSHDRRIGASAVLKGLAERGAIGLVTTHDLALTGIAESLSTHARNVHFEDQMVGGEMHFDYQLREGVVERSNALELMRSVGLDV
ncbi:MAG: DNA mismatch repair protein MutS [Bryobacteraceae bacterium]